MIALHLPYPAWPQGIGSATTPLSHFENHGRKHLATIVLDDRIARLSEAVDAVMGTDQEQQAFLRHAGTVWTLFKAVLPDPAADQWRVEAAVLHIMAEKVRSLREDVSKKALIQRVADEIEALLDDDPRS